MGNIALVFKYFPILIQLIQAVEGAFGAKSGADKKKAVIAAFTQIVSIAEPFLEAAEPAYAGLIAEVVDFLVKQLNAYANLSATAPAA